MTQIVDPISLTVSREVLTDISELSKEFADRMHELLERNTDNAFSVLEKAELKTLVHIAEFGQIVAMAIQAKSLS